MIKEVRFFDWEFERVDVLGILEATIHQHPQLKGLEVPIKAYQNVSHGDVAEEVVDFVPVDGVRNAFDEFRQKIAREKKWLTWQTGVSGVFYQDKHPHLFIPMLDLEFTSTSNLKSDVRCLENGVRSLNTEGSFVRSGDIGMGSYFFIGYDPIPYTPNYWQFLGKALSGFSFGSTDSAEKARKYGQSLEVISQREDSVSIANEILKNFPSIGHGQTRDGVFVDPRWVAHRIIQGFTILRQTPGKNYDDRPLQVAAYY